MQLPIYIADAFTTRLFGGNPAAVCPLEQWLPDDLMQQLATENNLSETVFFVPQGDDAYAIRWFTPAVEVKLCGHATLAAAHIMHTELGYQKDNIVFHSASGPLHVTKAETGLQLDFPADQYEAVTQVPAGLLESLHVAQAQVFKGSFDYLVVLGTQQEVEALTPDFATLATIPARGVVCTAPGTESDIVARCFFPQSGINEDPVTGSAHTLLVPYWAEVLDKNVLTSIQLSARRGYLHCTLQGNRVLMQGNVITYLRGMYEVL